MEVGAAVIPLVELFKRAHQAGIFIYPSHEVERVVHSRLCVRPRVFIAELHCRKLHVIEHGLKLHDYDVIAIGNRS